MFCQKCFAKMTRSLWGHSKGTLELWECSDPDCDYTFEMRTTTRGFNYCFEQERDLAFQPARRHASGRAHTPKAMGLV